MARNNTSPASSLLAFGWAMNKIITPDLVAILPTLLLLLLTSILFLFLLFFSQHSEKSKRKILPPGPKPWPIVGSLLTMFINKPAFRWILDMMKDKEIGCIKLGNTHVIVVNCPAISREFLKKQDANFASRPLTMATEYSGRGFLSVVISPWGDQWKKMRRVVASEVINPTRLRWQFDLRVEEADNLVQYIYNQCRNSEENEGALIDVRLAVQQYCGNVIRRMIFNKRYFGEGRRDGGPGIEEEEHVDAAFTILSLIFAFSVSDYIPCLRLFDMDGHEKIMKKAIGVINKYHDPIIDERLVKWRGGKKSDGGHPKELEDILDILISLKDSDGNPLLTTEEIKAQAAELIYATVDNPSNIAEWALAELLNQPHVLHKAMEELDRVVGKEKLVQESDFSQLPYIKACAREALRLHPVAPFNLPHVSSSDTTVVDYFIPKGSHVLLSRVGLGRSPKVWNDPLKFDPERHLEDGSTHVDLAEPELRFISFTTGRRGCMGAPLGTVMTYMLLVRLLQGFSWSLQPGLSSVDLSEEKSSLFMVKPLHVIAKPRLPILGHI